MKSAYTAVLQQDGKWWIGWIEEVPGVNSQAATRRGLLANLRSALREALALYRKQALAAATGKFEEEILEV
ncbi:MAG: type II toxin-antitoxin system HicB family antitoxin [Planctomycetes bacterium]|nr:type II toxin-antitoxin system HicB family antitoxin [Planctomycetota bacterium]